MQPSARCSFPDPSITMPGAFGAAAIPLMGCVTLLTAEILTILAMAAPFWATFTSSDAQFCISPPCKYWLGLWRKTSCNWGSTGVSREDCSRWDHPYFHADWHHAVQGLESLAVIFFAIPLIVLPVYIYVALGLYYRSLMGTMAVSVLIGTGCNIAGVIVFGVKIGSESSWNYSWCLIVCVIGGGLGLIAFIIILIATINKPEFAAEKYFASGQSGFYVDRDRNRLYVVETNEPVKIVYPTDYNEPPYPEKPNLKEPRQGSTIIVTPPVDGLDNSAKDPAYESVLVSHN